MKIVKFWFVERCTSSEYNSFDIPAWWMIVAIVKQFRKWWISSFPTVYIGRERPVLYLARNLDLTLLDFYHVRGMSEKIMMAQQYKCFQNFSNGIIKSRIANLEMSYKHLEINKTCLRKLYKLIKKMIIVSNIRMNEIVISISSL